MSEQTALTLAAAVVGFVAAVFFCIGNASNSVKSITAQSTTFWDVSEPVARALASQRAQYVIGALLLLISFGLQIWAAVASSTNPSGLPQWLDTWPRLLLTVLVSTAGASWCLCRALDKTTIDKVLLRHKEFLAKQEQK